MNVLIYYAIPVFLLTILLELWLLTKKRQAYADAVGYETKDSVASISMGLGNVVIAAVVKTTTFGALLWIYQNSGFWREFLDASHWWAWLILLFADDFCYYWFHRVSHEVRFGWAAHINHHSSEYFNLSTALRQSWTTPFYSWLFFVPLAVIGFHPAMIFTMHAISLLYQYWIHTETIGKLGPLEWFMNTPSHHRVHHGANPQYIDRNYGGFFIIYDKLFGSFEPEGEKVNYGLVNNIKTFNLLKIAFHHWQSIFRDMRRAKYWRHKWQFLFRRPEWVPDGDWEK